MNTADFLFLGLLAACIIGIAANWRAIRQGVRDSLVAFIAATIRFTRLSWRASKEIAEEAKTKAGD